MEEHLSSKKENRKLFHSVFITYLLITSLLLIGTYLIIKIFPGIIPGNFNQPILFGTLGAHFILFALLFFLITKRTFKPLRKLAQKIQLFLDGYWEQRVNIERSDEIGSLAENFNTMADEIVNLYVSLESMKKNEVKKNTTQPFSPAGMENNSGVQPKSQTQPNLAKNLEFLKELSSTIDNKGLSTTVHTFIQQFIGDVDFYFGIKKPTEDRIDFIFTYSTNSDEQSQALEYIMEIAHHVILNKTNLLLDDDIPGNLKTHDGQSIGIIPKSGIAMPIMFGEQVLGVMIILDLKNAHRFNQNHLLWMNLLAYQVSPLILVNLSKEQVNIDYQTRKLISNIHLKEDEDTILRTAEQGLQEILHADQIQILIKPVEVS